MKPLCVTRCVVTDTSEEASRGQLEPQCKKETRLIVIGQWLQDTIASYESGPKFKQLKRNYISNVVFCCSC